MKKNTRLIHKWIGLISCLFILLVALTAIALNHSDLYRGFIHKQIDKTFVSSQIKVLAIDPFEAKHLVASDLKGLFQSRDQGKSWSELKLYIPAENVNNIVFDPIEPEKLIVSLKKVGIFISDDAGEVWDELALPFNPAEGEYIENIVLAKDALLIKTRFGLYTYQNHSEKWQNNIFKNVNKQQILDFDQLIYNIHTGKILGETGVYLYDFLSFGLILLAISGIYLSFKPKVKLKNKFESKYQVNEQKEAKLPR